MTIPLSLSVFIPMFNEEENAPVLIPRLQQTLREITDDYEIVIVDDASRDSTVAVVEGFIRNDPRIRMVRHETNSGYGAALRTGFLSVTKEIVFYTDADLPIDFGILKEVVPRMEEWPVVLGYRIDRHDTWKRWLFSRIYNLTLRLLFGVQVRDVNFSFKMFRREVVDRFKDRLRSESVLIDGEILVWLTRLAVPFLQWPVDYRPREHGVSTLGTWGQALFTFREIRDLWMNRGKWANP